MNPVLEETFKLMCGIDEENQDKSVNNMRLKKYILKKFLAKRYPPRICNKFCTLFQWDNSKTFKEFYKEIDEILVNNANNTERDLLQHIHALKQVAFTMFDMNQDNSICDYDLFSLIKNSNENLYIGLID